MNRDTETAQNMVFSCYIKPRLLPTVKEYIFKNDTTINSVPEGTLVSNFLCIQVIRTIESPTQRHWKLFCFSYTLQILGISLSFQSCHQQINIFLFINLPSLFLGPMHLFSSFISAVMTEILDGWATRCLSVHHCLTHAMAHEFTIIHTSLLLLSW